MEIEKHMGNPRTVEISDTQNDSKIAKTLLFDAGTPFPDFEPGQFLMIWVPGVDEIPMSISYWESSTAGITINPVGDATIALSSLSKGDRIGIRGPFGNPFTYGPGEFLVVGGGIGMAPLRPLVHNLLGLDGQVTLIIAARTKSELVYLSEFESYKDKKLRLVCTTDDGSKGHHGIAKDATEKVLASNSPDAIYACGPELMLSGLHQIAMERRIPFQASLERFMKCGCGICGTCALDPTGDLVCLEGPVFTGDELVRITEFGKYNRDSMGVRRKC
ncbi:MAG: dihydroorotate dehydrogenase electron transfer subunit [Candidatus Hodarchaeota archaeon]